MSVGGQNLWASVLWLALFVAVAAVIVLIVVWIGRRRGSTTIALDAADTLSRVWLAAVVLGVIAVVIQGFQPFVSLADVPAALDWPGRPDGSIAVTGDVPTLESATARAVDITAVGVTAGTRAVIATGALLSLALWALPAAIVQVITRQTLTGRTFARRTASALTWGAIGFLVFGTTADIAQQIGRNLLAREVLPAAHSGGALTSLDYLSLTLPLWPAAVALALAALATVFRYGAALETQTAALRRDTEGLV